MSLDESTKHPSFIRYQRVETILKTEPAFRAKVAIKTEIVMKPDGKQHKFSEGVVKTTEAIHAAGLDPYSIARGEVIKYAMKVIGIGAVNNNGQAEVQASPLSPPRPAAKTKPKPAAKVVAKPAVKAKPEKSVPAAETKLPAAPSEPKDDMLCPEVAVYSMLMGARTLAEKHDKKAGFEKRMKALETLAKEFRDLAKI